MKKIITVITLFLLFQGFSQQKELTLNDAVLGYYKGLYPKTMSSLQWVSEAKYIYKEGDAYIIKDIKLKTEEKIELATLQKSDTTLKRLPRFVSIDETNMIFRNKNTMVTYNYKTNEEISKLTFDEKASNINFNTKNGNLAYTIDNNLYVATATSPKTVVTNFTDKNIVAGQAIARYEFGISKGIFWSPKGTYLAFYEKDETNVTDYPLVDVTTYPATVNNIKYPMAGQGSELAKVGIYNVVTNKTIYLKIDNTDEHYLTNLSWSPDEKYVFVAEVNRGQNHFSFNSYNAKTGKKIKTIFEESNKRWVEPEHDAVFLPGNNKEFIWMSERDGFQNLYLYKTKGKLKKQLTKFQFVVKSILGFDKLGDNVLVTATGKDGRETHVYKINVEHGEITKVTSKKGTHRVQLKGNYLIDNFSNQTTPREINIINVVSGEETNLLTAENPLKDYKIGATEFRTLVAKDGQNLYARIIKPANFDYLKKYPVLVYVYGGTHAQLVTNTWLGGASLWMHWLATQKDYIVFTIDNRGSANRGFAFESIIHRKAGEVAMEDQLKGVEFIKMLPYVDANRIAVHGWSYGGFMASSLLLRNPTVYTTAVAGGPVTDWKYYEVMYGERYMDTPEENPEGYAKSRVGKYLENLGDNKLLIIHGSVDPTVVPQHSMTLLKEAVEKNVQIDFFTYPMHPHNVRGKDRVHLMQKVLDYVLENNK